MKQVTRPITTFSLMARDEETGDLGVAVASRFLSVGAYVPSAASGAGAVASQAFVNTTFGSRALRMMAEEVSPSECAWVFQRTDDRIASRQFGIVSRDGESATFTGSACHPWAGGKSGHNFAAQGNLLAGPAVVDALVETFTESTRTFPEHLLEALAAADAAGGDRRGRQSAALIVVGEGKGYGGHTDRWVDLRVDDHAEPVAELARLLSLHRLYLDKPSEPPRELSAEEVRWVQALLRRLGHLEASPTGRWDNETESASERLFGIENLEERWLDGPSVDPAAWNHLRSQFGTNP